MRAPRAPRRARRASDPAPQQALDLAGGQRLGEQEALRVFAPERAQARELTLGLDALRNDAHAERAGHADDRLDDRAVAVAVLAEAHHERAVDLQAVERVALEIPQRRVAGAEVVEQ